MMMRYWRSHGQPSGLPILRANPAADAMAAQIRLAGHDSLKINGKTVPLVRYTVANVVFGREILWLNQQGELAALMNFAGGLPLEAVRKEYEPALSQLVASGVAQELKDLRELEQLVPPEMTGSFAIAGATLVDGTGHAPCCRGYGRCTPITPGSSSDLHCWPRASPRRAIAAESSNS
jgi:hypothetical protein